MSDLKSNLKKLQGYAAAIEVATRSKVAVGLPKESAASKVYGDGIRVIDIGIAHEFGTKDIPQRSFLRAPFLKHKTELNQVIQAQFKKVFEGADVDSALGIIGVKATNISRGAFRTGGYGDWPDIQDATKAAKGSSRILIDTGTLRNTITWVLR